MEITAFNIKIIDTAINERVLIEEFTQYGSPQLIYNGDDDRFSQIVASELHFNFEVGDKSDAKFLHLFTGSETRYKVILEDYSDSENPITLWTGFLLPEQFGEPYTNNAFFVSFIATDGLGRIKSATLPTTFYNQVLGISVVLADCLKLTGLSFPIYIAPAIINAYDPTIRYSQIAVNTTSYFEKGQNPYEIIENLLESIGCKLFMFQDAWYVVGINRLTDTSIEFESYDEYGVYIEQTTVNRTITPIIFYSTPTISIQPPFKRVVIDWDKDQDNSILPEDIVYQPQSEPINWSDGNPVIHWAQSTENFSINLSSSTQKVNFVFDEGGYLYNPRLTPIPNENPFYVSVFPAFTGGDDLDVNYISLISPIYLQAKDGDDQYLTLKLEFTAFFFSDITAGFEAGDYDESFYYELHYGGNVILTNRNTFTDYEGYNFELDIQGTDKILGKMEIKKIPIASDGYLDLRLCAPINVGVGTRVTYRVCEITYQATDELLDKVRDIDFTTKKELDIFHGDDRMSLTNRQFLFTDDVTIDIDTSIPAFTQQMTILNKVVIDTPSYSIGYVKWYISYEQFLLIQSNPLYLYIQKESDGSYVNYTLPGLNGDAPIAQDEGGYFVWELYAGPDYAAGAIYLAGNNLVWLMVPTIEEELDDVLFIRENWRRYEIDEDIRFTDALARVYHDTVPTAAFKISGDGIGFISPLELITFHYIEGKTFIVTNNTMGMGLFQTRTALDLVEATKFNVNDYVTE